MLALSSDVLESSLFEQCNRQRSVVTIIECVNLAAGHQQRLNDLRVGLEHSEMQRSGLGSGRQVEHLLVGVTVRFDAVPHAKVVAARESIDRFSALSRSWCALLSVVILVIGGLVEIGGLREEVGIVLQRIKQRDELIIELWCHWRRRILLGVKSRELTMLEQRRYDGLQSNGSSG